MMTLAVLSVATAMLCKEQGITILGVCFAYELFVTQKVSGFQVKISPVLNNLYVSGSDL